jgi:hypothetical protein
MGFFSVTYDPPYGAVKSSCGGRYSPDDIQADVPVYIGAAL